MKRKVDRIIPLSLLVLVMFQTLVILPAKAWSGDMPYDCESGDDFYAQIEKVYASAQDGTEQKNFIMGDSDWLSEGCLAENAAIKPRLRDLIKKIISDPRLHESATTNAALFYAEAFGPDSYLLNYLEKSAVGPRRAIVKKLLQISYSDSHGQVFHATDFFKKQVIRELDPAIRLQLIEFYGPRYIQDFESLRVFCEANKISLNLQVLIQYRQMSALDYLFNQRELLNQKIKFYNDQSNRYSTVSQYILTVLGRNLEVEFPAERLNSMSSKDLRLLRNAIYATYGKTFRSKMLQHYYFGEYPYVQEYCRNGKCGLGQRTKGQFQESDLTMIDKANIDKILKIDEARLKSGRRDPDLFIENYDLNAFLQYKSDNFTFSSPEIQGLRQYKLDLDRRQIWIWDQFGVSGWDLTTEKRLRLIRHARGPLYLSKQKRLLAYQAGNKLILENVDTGKTIFEETVHVNYVRDNQMPYYLSDDGRYFVFFNIPVQEQRGGMQRLIIVNIENNHRREIKFDSNPSFNYLNLHPDMAQHFIITQDNWLITILDQYPGSSPARGVFLLVPLEENSGDKLKVLAFRADYIKYQTFHTLLLSNDGGHLVFYLSNEGPVQVYRVADIINAKDVLPDPICTTRLPLDNHAVNYVHDMVDGRIYVSGRAASDYLGSFPISKPENIESIPLSYSFGMTSFLVKDRIFAQGHGWGFVVLRRY